MLTQLIRDNYSLYIEELKLIESHFGTDIYLLHTDHHKYIVKALPLDFKTLENEGYITEFLYSKRIPVPKLLKNNQGDYIIRTDKMQFHIQDFIEGSTLAVNTAPDWFLKKSAQTLGKIQNALKDYITLKRTFDADFFDISAINRKRDYLNNLLTTKEAKTNEIMKTEIMEQIKHAEMLSTFNINTSKLTYSNSHGDYYIGQIITKDELLTVIDWSSVCCLPICIEAIMSYSFADPACEKGNINVLRLKEYIKDYSDFMVLSDYDKHIMPYLFYWHLFLTNYSPPFSHVPEGYKKISELINNLLNWLYKNVDDLSSELSTL